MINLKNTKEEDYGILRLHKTQLLTSNEKDLFLLDIYNLYQSSNPKDRILASIVNACVTQRIEKCFISIGILNDLFKQDAMLSRNTITWKEWKAWLRWAYNDDGLEQITEPSNRGGIHARAGFYHVKVIGLSSWISSQVKIPLVPVPVPVPNPDPVDVNPDAILATHSDVNPDVNPDESWDEVSPKKVYNV